MPKVLFIFYWYAKPHVSGSEFRCPFQNQIYIKEYLKNDQECINDLMPTKLKLLTRI